ncbi:MAG: hypothetical protein SRB2_04073 [Desulfobacteraceae bacterium Eth-SRB2]|nr:MAG: hypothetical protein SRB2_04073 [Desulfobacteraceae bacterium Eth-SRB2]
MKLVVSGKIWFMVNYCLSINEVFCSRSRHAKKIIAPVRSAGPTGQAGIYLIFRGLFFEHNADIGPRLNIKYGFNRASKKTIYGWTLTKTVDYSKHDSQADKIKTYIQCDFMGLSNGKE